MKLLFLLNHGSNHSNLSRTLVLLIDSLSLDLVELYMFEYQIVDVFQIRIES
jgi:hypothetical protein